MAFRTVGVNFGPGQSLHLMSKIIGAPGAPASRLIEAALRVHNGEDKEAVIKDLTKAERASLKTEGRKYAHIDERHVQDLKNVSQAARIGLGMILYDLTYDEAVEWERDRVPRGRPRKETPNESN